MKTIIFGLILSVITLDSYAQSSAVVHGQISQRGYVKVLEDKVDGLNAIIAELNARLADFGPRLKAAENRNNAINICANKTPPMLYAGGANGCVELKPAPCELCNPDETVE